ARIAAAHKRSEPGGHDQFSELINNNLIDADQSLLDARMTHSEGNHKKCSFHCQMTTLKLELALRHMEKGGGDSGLHLSGKAQEYISLLITGIVEFKTLIEWKNCNLRPAVKQWFVESVELYEDALNHLRFEKPKAAECAALGGLLLQDYICRAAEDEH